MKYKNLNEWLDSGLAKEYDFVEDTQNDENVNDFGDLKEDVYEQFLIYKYPKEKSKQPDWDIIDHVENEEWKKEFLKNQKKFLQKVKQYADIDDPDNCSDLLQEIYKELWFDSEFGFIDKNFMKYKVNYKKRIASDTMTSAMTRFTDAMKKIINEETLKKKTNSEALRKIRCIYEACKSKYPNQELWSTNFSIMVIAFLSESDRKELYQLIKQDYPYMECFLKKCHQIGNYCPVPAGFNSARSGFCASHDYWDLTLMKIREWYLFVDLDQLDERDQLIQEELLHNKIGANALYCVRWLESFGEGDGGWKNFVNTLYLQDYVDDKTYEVFPFWKNDNMEHGWKSKNAGKEKVLGLPDDIAEINMCLKEICRSIDARSERIIEALKNKKK